MKGAKKNELKRPVVGGAQNHEIMNKNSKDQPAKEVFSNDHDEATYGHLYDDYDYDLAVDIEDDIEEVNPADH